MTKVCSADIRSALKLRYPAMSHALMWEVAPSTGGGTRYADAVALGLWASHGFMIEGIEIKCSRSDFLNEMKQPEKSEPVMRFCHRWWLACPAGLVKPDELPVTWGMLELSEGGVLRQKVKAPKLEPVPATTGFLASMMRRHAGLDEEMSNAEVSRRVQVVRDELQREADSDRANRLGYKQQAIVDAEAKLARITAETGLDLSKYGADDQIIRAIKTYQALDGGNGWGRALQTLRQTVDGLQKALVDMEVEGEAT